MKKIKSVDDIVLLKESFEVEFKLAKGKDGTGALPKDFWASYSAFANSHGGIISQNIPNYFVDYQEKNKDPFSETRWLDRIVPDGTWSGNLFDFYRKVQRKLVEDLKVPFTLEGNVRQDDTPQHKALREALVNTLVHADYSDHLSVLIIKDPYGYTFRNPGNLRVPADIALKGGSSDCRNRTIQQMFLMIGLGERAGSGLPRILHGWKDAGNSLKLEDYFEPSEHTVLKMLWNEADLKITTQKTTQKQCQILEVLIKNPGASRIQIAETIGGITADGIKYHLKKLQDLGILRRIGPDKGGYWEVLRDDGDNLKKSV